MPAPWIDQFAPSQWVQQPANQIGHTEAIPVNQNTSQNIDTILHYKVAGTIIMALVVVFVLQQSGFRFVVAASSSAGVGR